MLFLVLFHLGPGLAVFFVCAYFTNGLDIFESANKLITKCHYIKLQLPLVVVVVVVVVIVVKSPFLKESFAAVV